MLDNREREILDQLQPTFAEYLPRLYKTLNSSVVDKKQKGNPKYHTPILSDLFKSMKIQQEGDPVCQGCSTGRDNKKIAYKKTSGKQLIYRKFIGNDEVKKPNVNYSSSLSNERIS